MKRQLTARLEGEKRALLMLLRLLCAVSIWRTATTWILPLCGAAAWWVTLLCLLPGLAVTGLLRLTMHFTRTDTLTEALRACLGRTGAWIVSLTLGLLLTVEGTLSVTALITLFTEGLGARGTQVTLGALTGAALLFSLHREGLARGAYFLRWIIAAAAAGVAVALIPAVRLNHLFPVWGDGAAAVVNAVKASLSLAWPTALLLTAQRPAGGRMRRSIPAVISAPAALLLLTLTIPHESLGLRRGLAAGLLLPARYLPNAMGVLAVCLLMLVLFLSVGAAAQQAASAIFMPLKHAPAWLPCVLLTGMFLTQTAETSALWAILSAAETWLLLPLAVLAGICLPISIIRRGKT